MLPKPVLGESTPNTKVGDMMEEVGSPMEMNQSGLLSPIAANPPSKRRRMDREESTSSSQLSPAVSRKAAILNAARQLEEVGKPGGRLEHWPIMNPPIKGYDLDFPEVQD